MLPKFKIINDWQKVNEIGNFGAGVRRKGEYVS